MPSTEVGRPGHPDPRPALVTTGAGTVLAGWRCESCGRPAATAVPRCPRCRGPMTDCTFGPHGIVWSSTVVRVPLPGHEPPYTLAYVDLDDGPRVLAHVRRPVPGRLTVGQSVTLAAAQSGGHDVVVEVGP